jgi:iron only hydrogenase large subunit-like protein
MGTVVKNFMKNLIPAGKSIYHVTLMPCYDKKLEASRGYFADPETNTRDVDTVLTPVELEVLLNMEGIVFPSLQQRGLDFIHPLARTNKVMSHLGSGSGGYTENVFRYAAKKFFGKEFDANDKLVYKTRRNRDFMEIELKEDDKVLLFAIVNGFRNIQTLVQRMKRKTCDYQFIEVMACPSGCLNGGAQLRSEMVEEKFDKIDDMYKSLEITELPFDFADERINAIYSEWFPNEEAIEKYLYTEFKAVPKTVNLLNINW